MYHTKKDKRSIRSCGLIYQALRELLAEQPYESISITQLVERAQVGRATFYRNFDSIDDVLLRECDERFLRLGELMAGYIRKTAKASELHRLFLTYWYEDSDIIELLVQARRYEFIVQANLRMLNLILERHKMHRVIPERYLDYLMVMESGMTTALLARWIERGKDIPPEEMAKLLEQSAQNLQEMHGKVMKRIDQKEISSSVDGGTGVSSSSKSEV